MQINDPKQAAVVATALRIFSSLGPLMGTQSLSDSQAETLEEIISSVHDDLVTVVVPVIQQFTTVTDEEMLTKTEDEMRELMEWAWLMDVLNHVEDHAEQGRAKYEIIIRARIAAQN